MIVLFLSLVALSGLVLILIVGLAYRLLDRPPKNSPSNYLKQLTHSDDAKKVVVFMGDSITHGRIGINYVEMIENQLCDENLEFINAGINSELAWNNLQRVEEVIQCKPYIVTVLIGTNDANASMAEDSMKSYVKRMKLPRYPDIEWYRESLVALVKKLKNETDATVALLSIPTIGENSSHPAYERSTKYSNVVRDVAQDLDIVYLPLHERMVESLKGSSERAAYPFEKHFIGIIKGIIKHYLLRKSWDKIGSDSGFDLHVDYLHLNTEGAQMVADLVIEFIRSILIQT